MYDDPSIEAALERAARRNNTSAEALRSAMEHESSAELAQALRISLPDAQARMERVQRVLVFNGDWGAGCRLLSDEVRAELLAALEAL